MKNLSIIIPVYNEEKAIEQTINTMKGLIRKSPDLEIIFVNDGSTDNTQRILNSLKDKRIRVITHDKNKGYGAALKSGAMNCSNSYVATTDADGTYPNEKILDLFDFLLCENADMVVGARKGKVEETNFFRKFCKYLLTKLAENLSEKKIIDLNSGMRIVRRDLVLKALRYLPDGFSFTTTLTLSLLSNNNKILYCPINYYKRKGKSKIKPIRDTLNFLQLIIRTVMFFNPLKIFLPLSGFFILASFVVLVTSYLLGRVLDITTILLFVTGLHFLAIGLLADLIDKRLRP